MRKQIRASRRVGRLVLAALVLSASLVLGAALAQAASAPSVTTGAADHLTATRVQLHGSVDPNGEESLHWFEYGLGDCASNPCAVAPLLKNGYFPVPGEGLTNPYRVTQQLLGLSPDTTYHYRLAAGNSSGTVFGADRTFTTTAAPEPPAACQNEALREAQHATYLPGCRAYELVSPPDKNGANVIADSGRTRASADGEAVGFLSLGAFAESEGTGLGTEYIAERLGAPGPLGTGWATRGITPLQEANSLETFVVPAEPGYIGPFTEGLAQGVFRSNVPLTENAAVANVPNLYLRTDLRSPGHGSYRLITACPRCEEKGTPLPSWQDEPDGVYKKSVFAGLSADASHAAFESAQRLTKDTPALALSRVYEWDEGAVSLAGRIPKLGTGVECDDATGPACVTAESSIAGGGIEPNGSFFPARQPHVVSDGSDGHNRIVFTMPTTNGITYTNSSEGNIYVREDGHHTAQVNASERAEPTTYHNARYWDTSANGERIFFITEQALTNDAPLNGAKLYMYDASKPGSDPHNLTLISGSRRARYVVGANADGSYVYFVAAGGLVEGAPTDIDCIYLWHDGALSYVGPAPDSGNSATTGLYSAYRTPEERLARVVDGGRLLLFPDSDDFGLTGFPDESEQVELYLYDAEGSTPSEPDLTCVSCSSTGLSPAHSDALTAVRDFHGATVDSTTESRAVSVHGDRAFFSTADALVPEDTNGRYDAYEYDVASGEAHLLSSGTSPYDSYFLDASASGNDVFLVTAQPLVGWDKDSSYDLYDARVDGGFPEPVPKPAPCASAEACRTPPPAPPAPAAIGSAIEAPGNPTPPHRKSCPKGRRLRKVHGKTACVKPKKRKRHARQGGRK
jgi:hypothetical protein